MIRIKQLIVDDDLDLKGFRLLGIGAFAFEAQTPGTLPQPGEVLHVDDVIAVKDFRVTGSTQLGSTNTDLVGLFAFPFRMDSRTLEFTYDDDDRYTFIKELDGASPIWVAEFTYDLLGRVSIVSETTTLAEILTDVTYVGDTDRVATIERTVV